MNSPSRWLDLPVLTLSLMLVACGASTPAATTPAPPTDPPPTDPPPTATLEPTTLPTATPEPTLEPTPEPSGITADNVDDVNFIRTLRPRAGQDTAVTAVAYSPIAEEVATLGWSSVINIWDVNEAEVRERLEGHTTFGLGLAYTPDGLTLISGALDFRLIVWDVAAGDESFSRRSSANLRRVATDGEIILPVGATSSRVEITAVDGGDILDTLQPTGVSLASSAVSQASGLIALGDLDGTLIFYDRETFARVDDMTLPVSESPISDLEFSPDGSLIAVLMDKRVLYMIDAETRQVLYRKELLDFFNVAFDMAFFPDGDLFVVVGGGPITIMTSEEGRTVYTEDLNEIVWAVSVNGDGSRFALAMDHGNVHIMGIR